MLRCRNFQFGIYESGVINSMHSDSWFKILTLPKGSVNKYKQLQSRLGKTTYTKWWWSTAKCNLYASL